MAKDPFHQLDVIRNASQNGRLVTDCYRLMYKKELWIRAFAKLFSNEENWSSENKDPKCKKSIIPIVENIIQQLKDGTYRFTPQNRDYFPKTKTTRPFEEPKLRDVLVQEVMRMILENVYEPIFSENSHGYRAGRGYLTALSQIKNSWKGLTWCTKGEVQVFSDHGDYSVLINQISRKVSDRRFLLLLHNALTCGVFANWNGQKNYSSTPLKSTISPLLANIYLHELDLFIENLINKCTKGKQLFIENLVASKIRRIEYVRFVDDFVIGIAGSKKDAIKIKSIVINFLHKELHLVLKEENKIVTHLDNPITFLGYNFRRYKMNEIKLEIPQKLINEFANKNGYGNFSPFKIRHRSKIINKSELDILHTYNKELRSFSKYYSLANNYHQLNKLFYLAESSFIKTIANKRKSTSFKVVSRMRSAKQRGVCLTWNSEGKEKCYSFLKLKKLRKK